VGLSRKRPPIWLRGRLIDRPTSRSAAGENAAAALRLLDQRTVLPPVKFAGSLYTSPEWR
jgi:hypothetical protein